MEDFELQQHGFVTRSYDISQILDDIKVLSMNQEDIEDDEFVGNILLGENDELITVQNIKLNSIERYCYMLTANLTGLDKTTKFMVVKWIYVDSNALQYEFFEWLFRIVIKQSNSIHDKIMLKIFVSLYTTTGLPKNSRSVSLNFANCFMVILI